MAEFARKFNRARYQKSQDKLMWANVCFGRSEQMLSGRERIKPPTL